MMFRMRRGLLGVLNEEGIRSKSERLVIALEMGQEVYTSVTPIQAHFAPHCH